MNDLERRFHEEFQELTLYLKTEEVEPNEFVYWYEGDFPDLELDPIRIKVEVDEETIITFSESDDKSYMMFSDNEINLILLVKLKIKKLVENKKRNNDYGFPDMIIVNSIDGG